jgi:GNAT superfamily N-acetyltransferase
MNIRPAQKADKEACARLWQDFARALMARGLPFRMPDEEGLADWCERQIQSAGDELAYFVADDNGEVVGMAIAQVKPPYPDARYSMAPHGGDTRVLLEDIVVAEKMRSQGIGAQLVDAVEAWARTKGATQLMLNSDLNGPAAKFYLKLGFERAAALYIREINSR